MKIHEAMSLYEITDMIQTRLAERREAASKFTRPMDPQSIIAAQAARLTRNGPRGTTIVAVEYQDGVVMTADRLATQGWGDVFSRTVLKLHDIDQNAVIGICGSLAFAQQVIEDLGNFCEILSAKIKRPVSLDGKSNLLKQIIRANIFDLPWHQLLGVSFGAILGGYDRHDRAVIRSFDTDGGVYGHERFAVDGSGYSQARDFLEEHFQYGMQPDEAIGLALGAIRKAGKFVTSVSHPLDDPPPTVKIISKNGINDVAEEAIARWILQTERKEMRHLFAKQNRRIRKIRIETPQPEGESDHGA
jgi:20S proteasome alpha/beta subunit